MRSNRNSSGGGRRAVDPGRTYLLGSMMAVAGACRKGYGRKNSRFDFVLKGGGPHRQDFITTIHATYSE